MQTIAIVAALILGGVPRLHLAVVVGRERERLAGLQRHARPGGKGQGGRDAACPASCDVRRSATTCRSAWRPARSSSRSPSGGRTPRTRPAGCNGNPLRVLDEADLLGLLRADDAHGDLERVLDAVLGEQRLQGGEAASAGQPRGRSGSATFSRLEWTIRFCATPDARIDAFISFASSSDGGVRRTLNGDRASLASCTLRMMVGFMGCSGAGRESHSLPRHPPREANPLLSLRKGPTSTNRPVGQAQIVGLAVQHRALGGPERAILCRRAVAEGARAHHGTVEVVAADGQHGTAEPRA